jgi:hypothetical protein
LYLETKGKRTCFSKKKEVNKGTLTICDKVEAIDERNEHDGGEREMQRGHQLGFEFENKSPDKQGKKQ